jgi:3-deoxy-D-manno-octulosonic-acid transferase
VIWLYNALLIGGLILLSPLWILGVALSPRLRKDFRERLRPLPPCAPGTVWLHAASVGEVEAAAPLLADLGDAGVPLVATTLTLTGRERLRARLPGVRVRLAPLDLPGLVHRSLTRAQVAVLVLVETEIWPNLLWAARGRGVEVALVSGRLSDRSFPSYQRLRGLFRSALSGVHIAARSTEDRDRFRALGVPVDRALLGGDLKLDRLPASAPGAELGSAIGSGPFLVGGSTHPGEEEALVAAWRALREAGAPELRLLLAPRHPERVSQVCAALEKAGVRYGLRSEGAADREAVILDTLGELANVYALAELVFAGGTLSPVGGHNLIEPVQAGRVVVHGPHIENQRSQQRLLAPLGVLYPIENAAELGDTLRRLWRDPERNAPAAAAAQALEVHRGATERAFALVTGLRARALERRADGA